MKTTILALCGFVLITIAGCGSESLVSPGQGQDADPPILSKPATAVTVDYTMTQVGENVGDPPATLKFTRGGGVIFRDWVNTFVLDGDLKGTATAILDGNYSTPNASPNAPSARTSVKLYLDVTESSLGLTGGFEGIITGKMRDGVLTDKTVAHGTGGFSGMQLKAVGTIDLPFTGGDPPWDPPRTITISGIVW